MRWQVFVIGKPKLAYARAGVEEYLARLQPLATVKVHHLKASTQLAEGTALLERSTGMLRLVLDERGQQFTSRALASKVSAWELQSTRDVALLIGGADGHAEEVRQSAGILWALSTLTLQHELALVIVLEQIYRAYAIKSGFPYHRD